MISLQSAPLFLYADMHDCVCLQLGTCLGQSLQKIESAVDTAGCSLSHSWLPCVKTGSGNL